MLNPQLPFSSIKWIRRALRMELRDFWVQYPLETVPMAGPKSSLHYYVYSDHLSWDSMELDPQGVPIYIGRVFGRTHNPSYIAWYGIVKLEEYLRGTNAEGKNIFLKQVHWLRTNYRQYSDGMIVWPFLLDWKEGSTMIRAPWPSAISQGQAISALVRGFRLTGELELLKICKGALKAFHKGIEEGGIRSFDDGCVIYAEYPSLPTPRILDGFLSSLLGLYDFFIETQDPEALDLLNDGLNGLKHFLPYWTYKNKWTWYGSRTYLCSRQYHTLNHRLLSSLARVSNDSTLHIYAERWEPNGQKFLSLLETFFNFLLTKNLYRIRHKTWQQKTIAELHAKNSFMSGANFSVGDPFHKWRSNKIEENGL